MCTALRSDSISNTVCVLIHSVNFVGFLLPVYSEAYAIYDDFSPSLVAVSFSLKPKSNSRDYGRWKNKQTYIFSKSTLLPHFPRSIS